MEKQPWSLTPNLSFHLCTPAWVTPMQDTYCSCKYVTGKLTNRPKPAITVQSQDCLMTVVTHSSQLAIMSTEEH